MRGLELFCGTKSFSKIAEFHDISMTTLDIDEQHNPTICEDILTWNFKAYAPGYFNIIWASPDCTSWSRATHVHRTLKEKLLPKTEVARVGNQLILKMLEIIKYFQPTFYCIENPRGRLRYFEPMRKLPYQTTVFYSNYGHDIQKATDLWSNIELWNEKPDRMNSVKRWGYTKRRSRITRSIIPEKLIKRIVEHVYKSCVSKNRKYSSSVFISSSSLSTKVIESSEIFE